MEEQRYSQYARGVITGVLSAVCVFLVIGAAGFFLLQGRHSFISIGTKDEKTELLSTGTQAKLEALEQLIDQTYYEDVEEETLVNGLYKGLIASLGDPYSAYYTAEEYQEMMISASAQYYGIGAVLRQDPETMQVSIVRVYEDSPADQAGLEDEDVIVQVDDIVSRTMELSELVTHIRGEENSTVHLLINRNGQQIDVDVMRGKVDVPTVDGRMLTDDIGYIMIAEFGEATADDFKSQVEQLRQQGMQKLIVDLRDNPGGMLDSVTEILDYILPEGLIVYTEDKQGQREEVTSDAERYLDLPMAVLINGQSASCSEIFAGAIRDYEYGTLIGTTTYGKGVVQGIRKLMDDSAVKLTTAKYFTPKGENIHGTGIAPDIELEYKYTGNQKKEYDYLKDNQVRKAINILKKK